MPTPELTGGELEVGHTSGHAGEPQQRGQWGGGACGTSTPAAALLGRQQRGAGRSQGTAGTTQRAPAVWQVEGLCQIACEPANKSSRADGVSRQLSSRRCCFYFQHQGSNAEALQRGSGEGSLPLFTLISCGGTRRAFPGTGVIAFCSAKYA